jgi:RimJ/RimL family protein N-acetyltransferase
MYPVRIEGKTVILREFTDADLDGVQAVVGDDRVTRWLSFDTRTPDEAKQMLAGILDRARLEPRTEYYLAVALPADESRVIGFARLGLAGVRAAKLGYAVRFDEQGQGHATAAARALVTYAFGVLGLHRVSAAIGPDNAPSLAMMTALGFQHEGRIRDHVHTNGAWRDSELYSVLEHEWPAAAAARKAGSADGQGTEV